MAVVGARPFPQTHPVTRLLRPSSPKSYDTNDADSLGSADRARRKIKGTKAHLFSSRGHGLGRLWLWSGSPSSQGWSLPQCPSAPEMALAQSLLAEIQLPLSLTPLGTRRCRGPAASRGKRTSPLGLSPIRTPSQGPRYSRIAANLSGS